MKKLHFPHNRLIAALLVLVCLLGLLPGTALAADVPSTIKMDDCTYNSTHYDSPALGICYMHQMHYNYNGKSTMGFCSEKGKGMGWSLKGHTWNNPKSITDPTVTTMMAYFYAHSTGVFTDQAHALGVDTVWDSDYIWTMNAWTQAIVWRYKAGLLSDPATACAEELLCVYNNLYSSSYTSINDLLDGTSFYDRAKYILDLGAQGVWGECTVHEYTYAGPGSNYHPANDVQAVMVGELNVTHEQYSLTIKKVDSTNPNKGLSGARFLVTSENGSYSKEVVTGSDGTVTLSPLDAGTFAVTELEGPEGYEIDNAGPQYVVLPNGSNKTVTVTFSDTPIVTGEGSIRKVDADDPTKGLAGAVIKIEGVDNSFVGTYTTGAGGYLTDVPWDTMPIGSFVATEVTPPTNYTKSSDPSKVKQSFEWDGKSDVSLVFENDARVKIKLLKLDDSDRPLPGCVFNIVKDGQIIGTEETKADGTITVTDVTEGMFAFVEVAAPAPFACLTEPVIAHVDQATINGGGTVTVTAADKKLPNLTILKRDAQTGDAIPETHFEIRGIHYGYHTDVVTGPDGKATLTAIPVDSYEVTEKSVKNPYVVGDNPTQTIWLEAGDSKELVFDNLKQPLLTLKKIDADTGDVIPNTVLTVKALDGTYQDDWTTGPDGTVSAYVDPGVYQVSEKSVPSPYYLPDEDADRTQTITLSPGDEKTLVFRNRKAPELTVFKENSITSEPIEHAKFHIVYTSTGEAAEAPATIDYGYFYTDSKGEIRLHEQGKRLYPGEFKITEVEPADGFQLKEPLTQTVIIHGNESKTVRFQNTPLSALVVWKYDSVTGAPVEGCIFQVKYMSGTSGSGGTVIGTYKTGSSGSFTLNRLEAGAYLVEELASDGDHVMDTAPQTAYISGKEQDVVQLYFGNSPKGAVLIKKIDASTRAPLSDVEFFITDSKGTMLGDANGKFVTDSAGTILISNLDPGTTIVARETRAKENYLLDDVPQTITVQAGRTATLEFRNQPKGSVTLYKFSSSDRKTPLEGVGFKITYADGRVVDNIGGKLSSNGIYYTDSEGQINISQVTGTLIFTEVSSVPGYLIDENRKSQTVVVNPDDHQSVYFYNIPENTLIIEKYLETESGNEPLKGVTFLVTDSSGSVIGNSNGEFVTGDDGRIVIDGVAPGTTVTAREIKVPDGVVLDSTPKTIKIGDKGANTLRFVNQKTGYLVIRKLDKLTKEPLSGVEFELTYADGSYVDDAYGHLSSKGRFVTNDAGEIRVPVVGTVVVKEVKTLSTHVIDEATRIQTVQVNPADTQTIVVYNEPRCSLTLTKLDAVTGKPVPNTEFTLKDGDGNVLGKYTTGADGTVTVTGLTPNSTVVVVESKVPSNYVLDPTPRTIIVRNGSNSLPASTTDSSTNVSGSTGSNNVTVENVPKVTLTIEKYLETETGNVPLKGVTFLVTDQTGAVIGGSNGEFTSDDAGRIVIPNLEPGTTVTAREISVPDGVVLDSSPKSILIKAGEQSQTLRVVNKATGYLVVRKLDRLTGEPLAGVEFKLSCASGEYVDDAYGHLSSLGLFTTDQNGEIRVPVVGTVVVEETKCLPGYTIDSETQRQVVTVNPADTQTIKVYNTPVGNFELIKVSESDKTQRIPNATFEIRRVSDGGLVDTITTGSDGRAVLQLDAGDYYAVETACPKEFKLDSTPHYFTMRDDGKGSTLTVTNAPFSGILLRKIDSATKQGIYGVTFLLYDSNKNPIGQYTSDDRGYVYIDDLPDSGRYYLRELENEGYIVDTQLKTVYVTAGTTTEITWENTAITGQIQVTKTSEDYNSMNGWPAGTPIPNTEFEIYNYKTGNLVDTIKTDKNGVAVSKPLPLGRYKIVESKAADFYGLDKTPIEVEIEFSGQIVKAAMTNKSLYTNVSIKKTGFVEVMPGQQLRYDFSDIANNSTTALTSFYWRDTLPTQAVRLDKIVTGTYNVRGNYKVVFKTNLNSEYRTMYDNLSTQQNYVLDASPAALGLASNEYVTEFMVSFGVVPANFRQVEAPKVYCNVVSWLTGGTQFTNQADVGGVYNGQWIMATSRWVTRVYKPSQPLPRTGY
nr:SpaA isopeptide-forming pilin-related protein [uncultured Oscillibacter sp.]